MIFVWDAGLIYYGGFVSFSMGATSESGGASGFAPAGLILLGCGG